MTTDEKRNVHYETGMKAQEVMYVCDMYKSTGSDVSGSPPNAAKTSCI